MKRTFEVTFELNDEEISEGIIELDQKVIDQVDDEWRSFFYKSIDTPEKIASMIARCMCVFNSSLSDIDGFADLDDSMAKMIDWPTGLDDFMVTAKEIKEK